VEQAITDELNGVRRLRHRVAAMPLVGYPLILCWQRGWLPVPQREAKVRLKDGRTLRCNPADKTQRTMYLGLFEPAESRLIAGLLGHGDVVVDVGAHIGWFATIAARQVGADGLVVAFEPYPANAAVLKDNLALNGARNVRVLESALGSRPGTLRLQSGGDSGAVTALEWVSEGQVEVPVTRLDDAVADVEAITLLKIDAEGWEANILHGGAETLRRTRNVLIEINRPALAEAGTSPEEIFALLRDAGFSTFDEVAQTGLRRFSRVGDVTNVLAGR
jgi:FkbM family methyltransferase